MDDFHVYSGTHLIKGGKGLCVTRGQNVVGDMWKQLKDIHAAWIYETKDIVNSSLKYMSLWLEWSCKHSLCLTLNLH